MCFGGGSAPAPPPPIPAPPPLPPAPPPPPAPKPPAPPPEPMQLNVEPAAVTPNAGGQRKKSTQMNSTSNRQTLSTGVNTGGGGSGQTGVNI